MLPVLVAVVPEKLVEDLMRGKMRAMGGGGRGSVAGWRVRGGGLMTKRRDFDLMTVQSGNEP